MANPKVVLQSFQTLLQGITGLRVERAKPMFVNADSLPIVLVYIESMDERRRGYGGALNQGRKHAHYQLCARVRDVTGDQDNYDTKHDAFMDLVESVAAKMRANQNLPGANLQVMGEKLDIRYDEPYEASGATHFSAVIRTEAIEEFVG